MSTRPIFTVRHPGLSRWQSSVEGYLRKENPDATTGEIRRKPMIQGNWKHVEAEFDGKKIPMPPGDEFDENSEDYHAYASQFFYHLIENLDSGLNDPSEVILSTASSVETWPYSTAKWNDWLAAGLWHYFAYVDKAVAEGQLGRKYRDYKKDGGGDINYSVIDWTFPTDATAIMVGDWGTNNDDAIELMRQLVADNDPDFIIHLGDIYYAGTGNECNHNFYNILRTTIGTTVPVFTIPGNHEYYDLGNGYYSLIDKLNSNIPVTNATQAASYFCLRMEGNDSPWQFVGVDTGYHDADPVMTAVRSPAPALKSSDDVEWATDKVKKFAGNTIMLSHHQLFSHSATMHSSEYGTNCANPHLYRDFAPFFGSKIGAWFWGHEHSYAAYHEGIFGLTMGRLLGCSSYEQALSDDPYANTWPMIPYTNSPANVQLPPNSSTSHDANDYYPHAGAVINFNGPNQPVITYYQLPSWENDNGPANPTISLFAGESIPIPGQYASGFWIGNHKLKDSDFQTDKAPALAVDGSELYIVYRNTDKSNNIWWDKLNVNTDKGKFSGSPQKLQPAVTSSHTDGSVPDTQSNPAAAIINNQLHVVYTDNNQLSWAYLNFSTNQWVKNGPLSYFTSSSGTSFNTNHGPSLVAFNGQLYLFFLSTSDNATVQVGVYNPSASASSSWGFHGAPTIQNSAIGILKSGNEIVPAPAVNSDTLYLGYGLNDGSGNIGFVYTGTNETWYDLGLVSNNGDTNDIPQTHKGMAACADDGFLRLVYEMHDNDHEIGWAIRDLKENIWSGGLPIVCQNGDIPATQATPGICMGNEYTYMSYPGNSNDTIWSAIQPNYPRE